jgi:hypothetical protein
LLFGGRIFRCYFTIDYAGVSSLLSSEKLIGKAFRDRNDNYSTVPTTYGTVFSDSILYRSFTCPSCMEPVDAALLGKVFWEITKKEKPRHLKQIIVGA